ncbi:MAG TPA: hypothetical protein VMT55_02205, partial [Candidatus Sulfotelmatobacter sp.]|nr:hypothetical protein [Candidatus Sulfotelmatobacter sp.]
MSITGASYGYMSFIYRPGHAQPVAPPGTKALILRSQHLAMQRMVGNVFISAEIKALEKALARLTGDREQFGQLQKRGQASVLAQSMIEIASVSLAGGEVEFRFAQPKVEPRKTCELPPAVKGPYKQALRTVHPDRTGGDHQQAENLTSLAHQAQQNGDLASLAKLTEAIKAVVPGTSLRPEDLITEEILAKTEERRTAALHEIAAVRAMG